MINSREEPEVAIAREIQCDVGHRIAGHEGACRNVHGHRYRILVTASGIVSQKSGESEFGMVADFGFLKEIMMTEIHSNIDHGFMICKNDEPLLSFLQTQGQRLLVLDGPPTAENLAIWCYNKMAEACHNKGRTVQIRSVTVWETPNCYAEYSGRMLNPDSEL